MTWIERAALGAMLGIGPEPHYDNDDLVALASEEISEHLRAAARLWVLAHPHEAAELRNARGATSSNRFLSLCENASIDAAGVR